MCCNDWEDNEESINPDEWADGYNMDADEYEKFREDHNLPNY